MKDSKHFFLRRLYKSGLVLLLVVCLLASAVYAVGGWGRGTRLSMPEFKYMDSIERQAWQKAVEVVGASRDAQERFVNEILALYYKVKDSDLVIFCNPGGWGTKPLTTDYQGRSWLGGMGAELTELGYKYCMIDDIRTGGGLLERLSELKELFSHYPSKAKETAAKIDFLTQQVSGLRIIITGQSNGAAFASEVARHLESNRKVYSIQVGCPFWYRAPEVGQSLVIDNNGIGADILTERDLVTLFKVNWLKFFIISHVPSFTPIDWFVTKVFLLFGSYNVNLGLKAPGHEYMWEYPGVGPVIEAFFVRNFGTR